MIPRGLGLGVINLIYFLHRPLTRVMLKMWSICVGHPLVSLGLGCIYLAFFPFCSIHLCFFCLIWLPLLGLFVESAPASWPLPGTSPWLTH